MFTNKILVRYVDGCVFLGHNFSALQVLLQ